MRGLKIALVHTDVAWECRNLDSNPRGIVKMQKTVAAISQAIINLGYQLVVLPGNLETIKILEEEKIDLIFNLCTGVFEKSTQVLYTGLLDKTGIPYTGSQMRTHLLALHKDLAKTYFNQHLIPTPDFQVVTTLNDPLKEELDYPLFLKPVHEGSSMGLPGGGLVRSKDQYLEGVAYLLEKFKQPVLVEKFIPGREFTVGVLGNSAPVVLPVLELDFTEINEDNYNTYTIKGLRKMRTTCPADVTEYIQKKIEELALKTYRVLGCQDFARIDIRMDPRGELYILEVNSLPALYPGSSITLMAEKADMNYQELIKVIIDSALERVSVYAA